MGKLINVIMVVIFLGIISFIIFDSNISKNLNLNEPKEVTLESIGKNLFSNYLLPFEILAIALTVGVIGAAILAFKK